MLYNTNKQSLTKSLFFISLFGGMRKKSYLCKRYNILYMKQIIQYIWMLLLLPVMIGCSQEEAGSGEGGQVPIEFTTNTSATFITRSIITNISDFRSAGFGVFAYSTGNTPWVTAAASATPNFMYNQQVTYSSRWTYSPVKYWPNDNTPADGSGASGSQSKSYISFFAYAPYGGDGIVLSENTTSNAPVITYTWGQDHNLLYATPQLNLYKYDSNGAKDDGRVGDVITFNFHHALALVNFKVRRKADTGMTVTLKSLSISGFYTSGTFNLGSSSWTSPSGTGGPLSLRDTDLSVTASTEGSAHEVGSSLLIPGSSLLYSISYSIGARTYTHTDQSISFSPGPDMGCQYTIIFTIDGENIIVDRTKYTEQW